MDYAQLAAVISAPSSETQLRQGTCVSHQTGGTMTLNVGGTEVAGVSYLSPPRPGDACWFLWQGGVPFVVGSLSKQSRHPGFTAGHAGPWSTANATWVKAGVGVSSWNQWGLDDWAGWDSANGRWTAPVDGWYTMSGHATWAASATAGYRGLRFGRDGWYTAYAQDTIPTSVFPTTQSLSWTFVASRGATFTFEYYQATGAALNLGDFGMSYAWIGHV